MSTLAALPALVPLLLAPVDDDPWEEYEDLFHEIEQMRAFDRKRLDAAIGEALAELDAPQLALIEALTADLPDELPEHEPFEPFDPGDWGGGKSRREIREGSTAWKRLAERIAPAEPGRELIAEVWYDFGTGTVVQLPEDDRDLLAPYRNLLLGFAPGHAEAEAALLARLDAPRAFGPAAEFFWHPYVELDGKYYEHIELYDVWSREIPNEVPDVEVRAFAALVHNEPRIAEKIQGAVRARWYGQLADDVLELHRHVQSARAVAALWLCASPKLQHGYANSVNYLQAWIARIDEDPTAAATRLEAEGTGFTNAILAEINATPDAYNGGNARQEQLAAGREAIRAAALAVFTEQGLLEP